MYLPKLLLFFVQCDQASEEEAQAIKERIIAARRKVHKSTGEEVAARWTFEEGVSRYDVHISEMDRTMLHFLFL